MATEPRDMNPELTHSKPTKDILAVASYHRRDFDLAVISFPSSEHVRVATSVSTTFRDPITSIGQLDKLPPEVLSNVCLQLDVGSVFRFRRTNLRARQVIGSLHEYRLVSTLSLDCLCALLRTGAAAYFSLSDFYSCLCQEACSACLENYDNFINLLTRTRCCSQFVRNRALGVRIATAASARNALRLSKAKSEQRLVSLRTLPGNYGMDERPRKIRIRVVDVRSALSANAGTHLTGGTIRDTLQNAGLEFMVCSASPSYNPRTKQGQSGVSCAGCQLAVEEGGVNFDDRNKVYSQDKFLKHFDHCKPAQLLWDTSQEGAVKPAEYPSFCSRGGTFDQLFLEQKKE